MNKKYELTYESIQHNDIKLYRIKRLIQRANQPTSRELLLDKNVVLAELAKREVWQTELLNRYRAANAKKLAKNPHSLASSSAPNKRLRLVNT